LAHLLLLYQANIGEEMKKIQARAQNEYDVVVKILSQTMNEKFVHIYDGEKPQAKPGTVCATEMIGEVVHKGAKAYSFSIGDRVKINCITKCGECYHADTRLYIKEDTN